MDSEVIYGKNEALWKIENGAMLEEKKRGKDEDESDWSSNDEEVRGNVRIEFAEETEGDHMVSEIKSKNEVKVKPFDKEETHEERVERLKAKNVAGGGLVKVGILLGVVEDRVLIEPVEKIILDIDNIVISKDRLIIGSVEDVFGPIDRPCYSIMNDLYLKKMVAEEKVKVGDPVFCIASEMKAIYEDRIEELKKRKGCDASNKFDEEPLGNQNQEDIWFSDDDQEEAFETKKTPGLFVGKRDPFEAGKKQKKNKRKDEITIPPYRPEQPLFPPQHHTAQPNQTQASVQQPFFPLNQQQMYLPFAYPPSTMYNQTGLIIPMVPQQVVNQSYESYIQQINLMYGLPLNYLPPTFQPLVQDNQQSNSTNNTTPDAHTPHTYNNNH